LVSRLVLVALMNRLVWFVFFSEFWFEFPLFGLLWSGVWSGFDRYLVWVFFDQMYDHRVRLVYFGQMSGLVCFCQRFGLV